MLVAGPRSGSFHEDKTHTICLPGVTSKTGQREVSLSPAIQQHGCRAGLLSGSTEGESCEALVAPVIFGCGGAGEVELSADQPAEDPESAIRLIARNLGQE